MVMVGIDSGSLTAQVGDLVLVVGGHFAMFYICQTNCCNGFAMKIAPLMLSGSCRVPYCMVLPLGI